ncbi:hypothetical protein PV-S19_0213 [Pacmanvirus S19]|nr:hypothetical protein PV-S19_0213 [Pacmanvirus S19]
MSVIWTEFDTAVNKFNNFLHNVNEKNPIDDWHVIFSMGTVARFDPDEIDEFTGYTGEYVINYPLNRIADIELDEIICNNVITWNEQSKIAGYVGTAVKCAYEILINNGYPYPGTEESDRYAIPCEKPENTFLWNVNWDNCKELTNLSLAESHHTAVALGGEFRRLDYMFPKVLVVITPDLEIYRF